jgi:hypothetical protein
LLIFLNSADPPAEALGVSLEGTLETIAIPDVLALLSVTSKTGELAVDFPGGRGRLWIDGGRVAGYEVGRSKSLADALFALLRLEEGSFSFTEADGEPPNAVPPADVAPLLEEAESRLAEWPGVKALVPSLDAPLSLSASVAGPVTLSPEQWELVAAIGGGKEVGEVLEALELGEFEGCKAISELVTLGLVQSAPAPEAPAQAHGPEPAAMTAEVTVEVPDSLANFAPEGSWGFPFGPPGDSAGAEEAIAEGPADEAASAGPEPQPEPVNRGLLLKFLGSARN